ncbi:hypothetical protein [Rikenella microfusus]|uniref:Uncharacterized protein n=2 Tax=Rikenella microfusus TaxID=28139 RepID=A0A379MV12_9BACT|nr:hypothetical protein [Rikenella microfusus]SUE34599.1 Uncharacterised protein [Rikenella microfusus]
MKLLPSLFLLSAFGVSSAAGPESPADRSRLFPTVLKMDTVSNTWRAQNAWARIRIANGMLTVTVWNRWGEERINPLFRITVGNTPERNEAEGTWSYEGTIRRTADGFEKDCTIESCTIIANTKNPDFTIVSADFTGRYRIGRRAPRKP